MHRFQPYKMNTVLRNSFELQIKSLTGFDFENFVKELFLHKYGINGFIPTRPQKDKGCDGIIVDSNAIIACYGPVKLIEKDFNKKIDEDYSQYLTYWKNNYPNWQFVVNQKLSDWAIKKVNSVTANPPIGLDSLIHIAINELTVFQQRNLATFLGIDKAYFVQDYLETILNHLLSSAPIISEIDFKYNRKERIDYQEKIGINYNQEDIDSALNEYEFYLEAGDFNKIDSVLHNFNDDEKTRVKAKIITDYKNCSGSFKERLQILTENYLNKYANEKDDDFRYYIISVLLYLFEQCLIGLKAI